MTMRSLVDPGVPAQPARAAPSLRAFLELAFRPLYLAGVAWALIAIGIWVYAPQILTGPLQGVAWHAHEMLWGFIATIAVAFLMTAGANWTGINPLQGRALGIACGLWLIARVGFLAGGDGVFWVAAAAELGFFVFAAAAMMRAVYRARNARNYAVPWLIVGLAAADALYLLAARGGDYVLLMKRLNAGLLVMALIALLISRRVIPFFAMRAVAGLKLPMQTRTGQVQLGVCVVAVICLLAGQRLPTAIALGIAGLLSLLQLVRWRPYAVRANPLLWILYIGYAGLGVGLVMAACAAAGAGLPPALPVHMIAMAGFSVLIIGMVTRTALGHLGRPLATDRSMLASYVLLLVAVALRLAAIAPSAFSQPALHLSAAAWIAALALYLWRFAPLLIRPRS
ncbi:MAG TPA: NnrS family protein [Caldimonas sp.]